MKHNYCCLHLEDAVLRGSIKEEIVLEGKPEYNAYIAEFVTGKKMNRIFKHRISRIDTKDIILKNCLWCGKELSKGEIPYDS